MTQDWDAVGYVISSKYRLAVLRQLEDSPATPTAIADAEGMAPSHISRALGRLRRRSIVELRVPETRRKVRPYALTPKGEAIWGAVCQAELAN